MPNKRSILAGKILLSVVIIFFSVYAGLLYVLIIESHGADYYLAIAGAILFPAFLIFLIFFGKRKKAVILWGMVIGLYILAVNASIGSYEYNESITIDTSPNINLDEYLPFDDNSKIARLDHEASLKVTGKLPRIDGAAALFPVYSAFVNETYPDTVELYDGTFEYNNTVFGYEALAHKMTDIFIGVYPSQEQIDYAKEQGTEFVFTPIGKEAFVFFVSADNPVESLTTEQIQGIYSGEIKNWAEVGGNNEEIVAFQRNPGSGSQSMLERFMDGKEIMEAPTEQINDLMSGIIEEVASDYKNKSNSMGFSFRYYVEGIIQNPDIKVIAIDDIEPTVENIKSGKYPVITPIYAVTYEEQMNDNVDKLLQWILSEEGQEIIEKTGYVGN